MQQTAEALQPEDALASAPQESFAADLSVVPSPNPYLIDLESLPTEGQPVDAGIAAPVINIRAIARRRHLADAIKIDDIIPDPYVVVEAPSSPDDVLGQIRAWSEQYKLLHAVQEVELAKAIEVGVLATERLPLLREKTRLHEEHQALIDRGKLAYEYMFGANIQLVWTIAERYYPKLHHLQFVDVVLAGMEGLEHAIRRFDYTRGNKFSTFAYDPILKAIQQIDMHEERAIPLPLHIFTPWRSGQNVPLTEEMTEEEAEATGIARNTDILSLDEIVGNDDKKARELTRADVIDSIAAEPLQPTDLALEDFLDGQPTGLTEEQLRILKDFLYNSVRGEKTWFPSAPKRGGDILRVVRAILTHPSSLVLQKQLIELQPWRDEAACKDGTMHEVLMSRQRRTELGIKLAQINKLCGDCTVAAECRDFAISRKHRNGVWGGVGKSGLQVT